MGFMITAAAITAIGAIAAVGIAVLPWSAGEVRQAVVALNTLPEALDEARPALPSGEVVALA